MLPNLKNCRFPTTGFDQILDAITQTVIAKKKKKDRHGQVSKQGAVVKARENIQLFPYFLGTM